MNGISKCVEGNGDDLIATVCAANLVQGLASFLIWVAQPTSDPRMGSDIKSSASGPQGLGSGESSASAGQESEGLGSEGLWS